MRVGRVEAPWTLNKSFRSPRLTDWASRALFPDPNFVGVAGTERDSQELAVQCIVPVLVAGVGATAVLCCARGDVPTMTTEGHHA